MGNVFLIDFRDETRNGGVPAGFYFSFYKIMMMKNVRTITASLK